MSADTDLTTMFVDQIPSERQHGSLYVSVLFRTSLHLCACGCGNEVWLPIRPDRHHLSWDGDSITMCPSVGNWNFPCRSHYWIRNGRIEWAHDDLIDETDSVVGERQPWWQRLLALLLHPFRIVRSSRRSSRRP